VSNVIRSAKQEGRSARFGEGTLRYREVEDEIEGTKFKHRISEIHATGMKRLSKIEAADDPADGAGDE
jgi:single-strand DNA-binding protein